MANERYSSGRKKSTPTQNRGVRVSTFQKKKKPHSLQVKSLYDRVGIDHLERLEIMDQLGKRLKRTIVTAEGGSPWGVWEHAWAGKF